MMGVWVCLLGGACAAAGKGCAERCCAGGQQLHCVLRFGLACVSTKAAWRQPRKGRWARLDGLEQPLPPDSLPSGVT